MHVLHDCDVQTLEDIAFFDFSSHCQNVFVYPTSRCLHDFKAVPFYCLSVLSTFKPVHKPSKGGALYLVFPVIVITHSDIGNVYPVALHRTRR